MGFETAGLIIEFPWRLQVSNEIVIGYSDCFLTPESYSYKNVEKILMGKRIMNILHFEVIFDLVVEFEGNVDLELFHEMLMDIETMPDVEAEYVTLFYRTSNVIAKTLYASFGFVDTGII